ncbi:MAG TPA: hypothetical protein PKA88_11775 [Polyangiaceae bacterium]|nr:hypothetical protein [Polyangiaceae bacterium]HMR75605.1 hypothetical protein [Polyangiaceae bacterium]
MGDRRDSAPPWVSGSEGSGLDADVAPSPLTTDEPVLPRSAEAPPRSAEVPPHEPAKRKASKKKRKNYTSEVVRSLLDGESETVVVQWLSKKGLSDKQIGATLRRARARIESARPTPTVSEDAAETNAQRDKDRLHGGLWFGGGLAVTVVSLMAADGPQGGQYVLAWGPMLYGGYRLLKSL